MHQGKFGFETEKRALKGSFLMRKIDVTFSLTVFL